MKKFVFNPILFIFLIFTISSCGGDDLEDLKAEEMNTKMLTANIVESDLVGYWVLSVMKTDVSVDLNKDGIFTQNLLSETKCFDPMSIKFNSDKSFSSVNARLDFKAGESDDQFFCMGNRTDGGTWEIDGITLTLNFLIDGKTYTDQKEIDLNGGTFSFDVSEVESQKYVADPGDSSVSSVTVVSLEYTKQ